MRRLENLSQKQLAQLRAYLQHSLMVQPNF